MLRCYLGMALHKLKRNREALDELGQVGAAWEVWLTGLGCGGTMRHAEAGRWTHAQGLHACLGSDEARSTPRTLSPAPYLH